MSTTYKHKLTVWLDNAPLLRRSVASFLNCEMVLTTNKQQIGVENKGLVKPVAWLRCLVTLSRLVRPGLLLTASPIATG